MGTQRRRLARFLTEHPNCCYCGGTTPATTQDHFPPRAVFVGRQWPEGYVYPACNSCNGDAAEDEAIITLLSRLYPSAETEAGQREVTNLMKATAERFPDLYRSLMPSANSVRRWLRKSSMKLEPGMTTRDVPILSLEHPRIAEAVDRFATKLFCSLYYQHLNRVLGPTGGAVFRWFTNAQDMDKLLPQDVLGPLLSNFPTLTRQNTSLHEQFFYKYGIASDIHAGAFLVFFNKSLAMLGFVFPDIDTVAVPPKAKVLRPFLESKGPGP